MAETPKTGGGGAERRSPDRPILLLDRYLIKHASALPGLDSPSAKAYDVEDREDPARQLFALVGTPGLPIRNDVMVDLRDSPIAGLVPLVDWDSGDWPPLAQRCLVMIFERPLGGRLMDGIVSGAFRMIDLDIPRDLIRPLVSAIKTLGERNTPHRAIRPQNLFFMANDHLTPVFGECITTPPGFDQPLMFEPIERAMALPAGRGEGTVADDIYSLGATLAVLFMGRNPIEGLDPNTLINTRIDNGSYAALCSKSRIPISLLEPLRGMMNDDPGERWSIADIEGWLDGHHHKRSAGRKPTSTAEVPYAFAGRNHHSLRSLAHAFTQNVAEAARVIRSADAELDVWLRGSLEDPERVKTITTAMEGTHIQSNGAEGRDDFIVSKIVALLDPTAPVRYQGFSFMPDAFGPALAVEMVRRGNVQAAAETLAHDVAGVWMRAQGISTPGTTTLGKTLTRMREFLQTTDPGFGMERCVYEFNPGLPCQSPLVIRHHVVGIEDLLPALDREAPRADAKGPPMDRHLAAFIAARFDYDLTSRLKALAAPREDASIIGMLSLLALLQWRLGKDPLHGLSSWVGGLLGPAINTYYRRPTRREIEREIPHLVRKGKLPELFDLIENAEKRKSDADGYAVAQAEFAEAEDEIREIESTDVANSPAAHHTGHQVSAVASIAITLMVVTMLFLLEKW